MGLLTSTNTYNNAFAGVPAMAIELDITKTSSTPQFDVGFGFTRADGNKYRYVQYGNTVVAGNVCVSSSDTGLVADTDNAVIEPAAAIAVAGESILPGKIGSRYVEFTKASIVKNQLAGGYFVTTDGTGIGYTYRIKGNTATGDPASGNLRVELYEPLKVTLTSTTDVAMVGSRWAAIEQSIIAVNYAVCGIACAGGSDGKYGWVCTHGVSAVTTDAGVPTAIGQQLAVSTTTGGTVTKLNPLETGNILSGIGYCLDIGDSAGCSTVYLQIE